MGEENQEDLIERSAEAVEYFIEHPEAQLDPVLRAYVNRIKRMVEELELGEGAQAILAKG